MPPATLRVVMCRAVRLLPLVLLACGGCGSAAGGPQSNDLDASSNGTDGRTLGPDGTTGEGSTGEESGNEAGAECDADCGVDLTNTIACIQSDRYAAADPCPSTGGPYTAFECSSACLEFHTLATGPTMCALGGLVDADIIPFTDAGTVVLCCPGTFDAGPTSCWGPFM